MMGMPRDTLDLPALQAVAAAHNQAASEAKKQSNRAVLPIIVACFALLIAQGRASTEALLLLQLTLITLLAYAYFNTLIPARARVYQRLEGERTALLAMFPNIEAHPHYETPLRLRHQRILGALYVGSVALLLLANAPYGGLALLAAVLSIWLLVEPCLVWLFAPQSAASQALLKQALLSRLALWGVMVMPIIGVAWLIGTGRVDAANSVWVSLLGYGYVVLVFGAYSQWVQRPMRLLESGLKPAQVAPLLRHVQQRLKAAPDSLQYTYVAMVLHQFQGALPEAWACLQRGASAAQQISPGGGLMLLLDYAIWNEDFALALTILEGLIRRQPQQWAGFYLLANLYLIAEAHLDRAQALVTPWGFGLAKPAAMPWKNWHTIQIVLGALALRRDEYEAATRHLDESWRVIPPGYALYSATTLYNTARLHHQQGDTAKARQGYEATREVAPVSQAALWAKRRLAELDAEAGKLPNESASDG